MVAESVEWQTGARLVTLNLQDDCHQSYPDKVDGADEAAVVAAAQKFIRPDGFVWVAVGNRAKMEGIRSLIDPKMSAVASPIRSALTYC